MSQCEGKAAFRDQDAAERAMERKRLGSRWRAYECDVCKLWHYGLKVRAKSNSAKQRRAHNARVKERALGTRMAQALRDAGWIKDEESHDGDR